MEQLRVTSAALQTMVGNWGNSAGELTKTAAPTGHGSSSQPSAAAMHAAHADVAIFTADLARQIDMRAQRVTDASTHYIAHEAQSTSKLSALTDSPSVV